MKKSWIVGRAIALGAALFYGFNTTLSRLAYDTGTTPVSLTLIRFALCALAMALIVLALRKAWKIEVAPGLFAVCVLGNCMTSIGHLGAVNYIPVSLSAIIFYTFPLLVVAWKRIAQRKPMARAETLAFLVAFVGIGIALGPDFHSFDPVGIALAFSGALGSATFILAYEKFPAATDSYVGTLWIMVASVGVALLALPFGFQIVPPREPVGWLYLLLITAATVTAFVFTLQAIARIGAGLFALFLNFEPVIILLLAWFVIGEQLTAERVGGIALIVFALFLSHWKPARPKSRATDTTSPRA